MLCFVLLCCSGTSVVPGKTNKCPQWAEPPLVGITRGPVPQFNGYQQWDQKQMVPKKRQKSPQKKFALKFKIEAQHQSQSKRWEILPMMKLVKIHERVKMRNSKCPGCCVPLLSLNLRKVLEQDSISQPDVPFLPPHNPTVWPPFNLLISR